jgi:tRNA-specific 2-thiouridylase
VHRFTIGQRRGLGLGGEAPRYVRHLDAATATVAVGSLDDLAADGLVARGTIWSAGAPPVAGTRLDVRIRHRHRPLPARLVEACGDVTRVRFEESGPAITPGQAAVFYRGDLVAGGGWIAQATA